MNDEQIYITIDGSENGKKWIDCSDDAKKASNIADLLQYILEECTEEEMNNIIDVIHEMKPDSKIKLFKI